MFFERNAAGESAALYPALFVSPGQFPAPEAFAEIVGGLRPDEPVLLTDYRAARWLLSMNSLNIRDVCIASASFQRRIVVIQINNKASTGFVAILSWI